MAEKTSAQQLNELRTKKKAGKRRGSLQRRITVRMSTGRRPRRR